ncbi:MAG: hypothetical protein AAB426_00980, partial [Myxococcota bacterium]
RGLRFATADDPLGTRGRELIQDVTGDDRGPLSQEATFEIDAAELGEAAAQAQHGTEVPLVELELEHHTVGFSLDTGPDNKAPPPLPKSSAKAQQLAEPTFRDCYTEALAAERAHRPKDAVAWLLQALDRTPDNPLDLHLRIASIALRDLDDLGLANEHVRLARTLDPNRRDVRKLRRELRQHRRAAFTHDAKLRFVPLRVAGSATKAPQRRRLHNPWLRRAIIFLAIGVIVGNTVWNAWTLTTPDAPLPTLIDPQAIAKLVAAQQVRLSEGRLVVTVAPTWLALPDDTKTERLKSLGEWAEQSYHAREVILTDEHNVLVGEASHNRVGIYR